VRRIRIQLRAIALNKNSLCVGKRGKLAKKMPRPIAQK